jgi:hypothetical protein
MSARAFIAFLRCEATQAEERAIALRTVAANIESHASAEGKHTKSISTLLVASHNMRDPSGLTHLAMPQQMRLEKRQSASRGVIPIALNDSIQPILCTSRRITSASRTAIRKSQREK